MQMKRWLKKGAAFLITATVLTTNLMVSNQVWAEEKTAAEDIGVEDIGAEEVLEETEPENIASPVNAQKPYGIKVKAAKKMTLIETIFEEASPSQTMERSTSSKLKAGVSESDNQEMKALLEFPMTEFQEMPEEVVLSLTLNENVGDDFSYGEIYMVSSKAFQSSTDWNQLNGLIEEEGMLAGNFERGEAFAGKKNERLLVEVTDAVGYALEEEWKRAVFVVSAGDESGDNTISFYTGSTNQGAESTPMLMAPVFEAVNEISIEADESTYVQGGADAEKTISGFGGTEAWLRNKYSNGADQKYTRSSIVRFPLSELADSVDTLEDCVLKMTLSEVVGNHFSKLQIFRVDEEWTRDTLTFQELNRILNGKSADAEINTSHIKSAGTVEISIMELIKTAVDDGRDTLSMAFKIPDAADNNLLSFYSHTSSVGKPLIVGKPKSQAPIASFENISVLTYVDVAPVLPDQIKAVLEDGKEQLVSVTWNRIEAESYAVTGVFSVYGTVEGTDLQPEAVVTVKKKLISDVVSIQASKDAYIQKGTNSGKPKDQWNPAWTADRIRVKYAHASEYTREGYIAFDLSGEELANQNQVNLVLKVATTDKNNPESDWQETSIYLLEDTDFEFDTITHNTAPVSGEEPCGKIQRTSMKDGQVTADVTEIVLQAIADGKDKIGFRLAGTTAAAENGIQFYSSRAGESYGPWLSFEKQLVREVETVEISTVLNEAPVLPSTVEIIDPADGEKAEVLWEEVEEDSYKKIGKFTVNGMLKEYDFPVRAIVNVVLPDNYVPHTYYVDATNGDDNHDGLTEDMAWKTLDKISANTFLPGDQILLKSGEIWNGYVKLNGSGMEGKPIIFSSYGEGNRPIINGGGTDYNKRSATVLLDSEEYWEISGLEITNKKAGENFHKKETSIYSRSGILIYTTDQNDVKDHIYVTDCYVHDVVSNGNESLPTTSLGGKLSGGIIFIASYRDLDGNTIVPANNNKAGHSDIRAEKNIVKNVVTEGIRNSVEGPQGAFPVNCTDVYIGNNYIEGTLGDGIVLNQTKSGGLIEKNIIIDAGTAFNNNLYYAAAWAHYSHDAVFQYNEVYGMLYGNADGEAFDADNQCYGTIFQYNYSHGNNGGACLFMGSQFDSIYRYNISANDGWRAGEEILNDHSNPGVNNWKVPLVYNNTFYIGAKNNNTKLYGYTRAGFCNFRNNVILLGEGVTAGANLKFSKAQTKDASIIQNNYFSDESVLSANRPSLELLKQQNNYFGDPMLEHAERTLEHDNDEHRNMSLEEVKELLEHPVESLRARALVFAPKEESPLIGKGVPIEGNELTEDIMGNPINKEHPTIGAIEGGVVMEQVYYNIITQEAEGGRITVNKTKAEAGETIVVTLIPDAGMEADLLTYQYQNQEVSLPVTGNRTEFEMPEADITIKAAFQELREEKPNTHNIIVETVEGGTVTVNKAKAEAGETIVVTLIPDTGMEADTLAYQYKNQSFNLSVKANTAKFQMPEADVTITAAFKKIKVHEYGNVDNGDDSGDMGVSTVKESNIPDSWPDANWEKSQDGLWKLRKPDGTLVTGWAAVGGQWYYLNEAGDMQTEWVSIDNQWYYLDNNGAMQTGWVQVDNRWYYLHESGYMQTEWIQVDNHRYYLDKNGAMRTGWIQVDNNWYYMEPSGKMSMGLIQADGVWYTCDETGKRL